jgi:hypothetical protein
MARSMARKARARRDAGTCVQAQIKAILGCQKLPPTETAPFPVRPARSRRSGCSLLGLQACVWHWPSALLRFMPPMQKRLPRPHLNGSPSTAPMPSCRTRGTSRQWNAWSGVFPIVSARPGGHGIFDPKGQPTRLIGARTVACLPPSTVHDPATLRPSSCCR